MGANNTNASRLQGMADCHNSESSPPGPTITGKVVSATIPAEIVQSADVRIVVVSVKLNRLLYVCLL